MDSATPARLPPVMGSHASNRGRPLIETSCLRTRKSHKPTFISAPNDKPQAVQDNNDGQRTGSARLLIIMPELVAAAKARHLAGTHLADGHRKLVSKNDTGRLQQSLTKLALMATVCLLLLLLVLVHQVLCDEINLEQSAPTAAPVESAKLPDGPPQVARRNSGDDASGDEEHRLIVATDPPERLDEEEPLKLSTRSPRQHFRLRVSPTSRPSSAFRLVNIRRRATQQRQPTGGAKSQVVSKLASKTPQSEPDLVNNQTGSSSNEIAQLNDDTTSASQSDRQKQQQQQQQQQHQKQQQQPTQGTKKINSATLKKLLIHTLPRLDAGASSASSSSSDLAAVTAGSSKPNFKFVFIQRATRAPAGSRPSGSNSTERAREKSHAAGQSSSQAGAVTAGASSAGKPAPSQQAQAAQQSLAASVSRQLANSLFYSTANLIGHNFTSATSLGAGSNLISSLSALAALSGANRSSSLGERNQSGGIESESAAQATSAGIGGPTRDAPANEDSFNQIDKNDPLATDIQRVNRLPSIGAIKQQTPNAGTKNKPKARPRPSKIYNLPVKFIANGQPNSVMFHSLKQHFATIKKFQHQQQGKTMLIGSESGGKSGKRQRPPVKLKGTNSRLIYLPLKYLSNAKPTVLSSVVAAAAGANATRASHKSLPAGSTTLSVKSITKSTR